MNTPARPGATGRTRQHVLRALADQGTALPLTELSRMLGGHPNTARHHADALVAEGLATREPLPTDGPGRRPYGYAITTAGRAALQQTPLDGSLEILLAVAEHDDGARNPGMARDLGRARGARRAAAAGMETGTAPWDVTVETMARLGFDPAGLADVEGEAVVLRRCPVVDVARLHPQFVCQVHAGLAEGVLAGLGDDGPVELIPFARPDGCVLRRPSPVAAPG